MRFLILKRLRELAKPSSSRHRVRTTRQSAGAGVRAAFSVYLWLGFMVIALSPSQWAQAQTEHPDTVTIITARGEKNLAVNPKRIAVFDWAALDTLNQLGIKVDGSTDTMPVDYLKDVVKDAQTVGTLFEPDYEMLNDFAPDLIIVGPTAAPAYDALQKIAPTIDMTVDTEHLYDSAKQRLNAYGVLFARQDLSKQLSALLDQSLQQAQAAVKGKGNGLVVWVTGHKMAVSGAGSRIGGWIHDDLGIPMADKNISAGGHDQPISAEYIAKVNPDWLFVLDRGAVMNDPGPSAYAALNNPLVRQTTAWQKGQVIYMPAANYVAAGGVEQLLNANEQFIEHFNAHND